MRRTSRYGMTVTQALADTIVEAYLTRQTTGGSKQRQALDTTSLPKEGDVVGGLYRLVRMLGRGVFGLVFLAERVDVPEHRVALKIMLRDATEERDIERELVMLAAAGHPNVVQLKDHGVTNRYVWFTMPVYNGETLDAVLDRKTLTLHEAYDVFLPVARGVEALHHAGLRHQDLKPENVFLAEFAGRIHPIILDLGVAAEKNSSFIAGTVLFAAPEQADALLGVEEHPAMSAKVDTYGLAATLLLSLVGWELYPGSNAGNEDEMREAQRLRAEHPLHEDALPDLQGEPRRKLDEAFRGWFALSPSDRPEMGRMAEQLDVLLEKEREEKRIEARQRSKQRAKLQRARWTVAGLLLLALAGLGVGYSQRKTLSLAQELNKAQKFGADSYDKLETCVAANRLTRSSLQRCHRQRTKDGEVFNKSLRRIASSGSRQQQVLAAQVADATKKLRACNDSAEDASAKCEQDKKQLIQQCKQSQKAITERVQELQSLLDQNIADTQALQGRLSACQQTSTAVPAAPKQADGIETPYDDPRETTQTVAPAAPAAANSASPAASSGPPPISSSPVPAPTASAPALTVPPVSSAVSE